jgi:hypothetical protein
MGSNKGEFMGLARTLLLALSALTACTSMLNQQNNAVQESSAVQIQPAATGDLSLPGTPDQASTPAGTPVIVESGTVIIEVGTLTYKVGDVITATVANGSAETIYTQNQQSDCSIATLEQGEGANWQPLLGCNIESLPRQVAIAPGQGEMVTINPLSTHFNVIPNIAKPAFGEGTYRLKFSYRLTPNETATEPIVVYSAMFTIQAR